MWRLAKSKGIFGRDHPASSPGTTFPVEDVLGAATPTNPRATHEVLSHLAGRFSSQNSHGTKRAEDVYFGISHEFGVAESWAEQRGAWVSITSSYIETLRRASSLAVGFVYMHRGAMELGLDEQQLLDGARGSALAFLDVGEGPGTAEWRTQIDTWESFLGGKDLLADNRAGVAWVMAHELGHLLLGDGVGRPDREAIARKAESCRSSMHEKVWPANTRHQSELIADHSAVDYIRQAKDHARPVDSLVVAMRSSFLSTASIAVDGWFSDKSAHSFEHPSPFLRNWALLGFWCNFLERCNKEGWSDESQPSPTELMSVTYTVLMIEWLAGVYRSERGGVAALCDDRELVHDSLCTAAGVTPPFRLDISLPS